MNKSLKILFFFNGVFVFASSLLGPLYALFVQNIDSNILNVSITWAVFLLSTTFFTGMVGKYGDKIKEKEFLLCAGYFIRGLVWFFYIFVNKVELLLAAQFVLGIGEALGAPAYDAIFAQHLVKNNFVKDYSAWKIISTVVSALAVVIGGVIVTTLGFQTLFCVMSMLSFALVAGVLLIDRKIL